MVFMGNTLAVDSFQKPLDIPKSEHDVLAFWDETHAFEKSVTERPVDKKYVFYDGPPFATGLPHYGHILASTIKDVIPRYWTMKGYRVERVWGWDCHGIPIENMIEKELELKGGKKGIESLGIGKFNAACRGAILRFDKEWEKVIRRIGRWVDFKHSYKTMDKTYMESVWWAFKSLFEKGLIYEGKRVILYCPRCATPLSNFEIAMDNSYKDLPGPSTVYKYKVRDQNNTFLLAWSTTPWNKLATPALAVNPDLEYVKVKQGVEYFILAKSTLSILKPDITYTIIETYTGRNLEKFEFELHYDFYPNRLKGERVGIVIADPYVTSDEGTGIVTLAVYGEDDYRIMLSHNVQLVYHVDDEGKLKPEVTPWAGKFMLTVNPLVNEDLKKRGLIYSDEERIHSVPVCYRCETRLYQAPVPAWFINVQKAKKDLLSQNENINWYPSHLKYGRFGKGIENAPDWNISRSRYWGTPMPVWKTKSEKRKAESEKEEYRIIGSIEELKKWAVDPEKVANLTDIHREFLDDIEVYVDDKRTIKGQRIPEVFDCWVESGSMPYASIHYPFEHEKEFKASHPSQFIAEYIAQTRAWFYTLHVMSVGLFGKHTFENAVTTGTILAEDGSKMSKSKKNYPDPALLFEKYGVDALRFYLMGSVVMKAENLNFSEVQVKEIYQKLFMILWNVFSFYKLYAKDEIPEEGVPLAVHDLDTWIMSKTQSLIRAVTMSMDTYDTNTTCRLLQEFVTELSTWYLRRSRERLRDDKGSRMVLAFVLRSLTLLLSPIAPFLTEKIYQNLSISGESIHLASWPTVDETRIDEKLEHAVEASRNIVETLLALRKNMSIPVRQPLGAFYLTGCDLALVKSYPGVVQSILDETNIESYQVCDDNEKILKGLATQQVSIRHIGDGKIYLDTKITQDLKAKGMARELLRKIQILRKEKGCTIDEHISIVISNEYKKVSEKLLKKITDDALVDSFSWGDSLHILTG